MSSFRFGLESEYLVARRDTFQPLWHKDLTFSELNECMETVRTDDLPSMEGCDLEAPHRKLMPFVVEGYHVKDEAFHPIDMMPKGVEIRTPVCNSLDECLDVFEKLYTRLDRAMALKNYAAVALSHHPVASKFWGPQYNRRYDFWLWAMEVMTTYGPDVNISLPDELAARVNQEDLLAKINYYGPAMTAMSVASPFFEGGLWEFRGQVGKSYRTFKRSVIAPPIEFHPHEAGRLEFKVFEMTNRTEDFRNYFLLFLTLLLDESLSGRAGNAARIYDSGAVARVGMEAETVRERATILLESCHRTLPRWGFSTSSLASFEERVETGRTPADRMIDAYRESGGSIPEVLRKLSRLEPLAETRPMRETLAVS